MDFDLHVTLMAGLLGRFMARRIGGEYGRAQPATIFSDVPDPSGKVEVQADCVVVTLDKRAHNPLPAASGLAGKPAPMPWLDRKKLLIRFA